MSNGGTTLNHIVGNRMAWLCIETACFYLYVLAAVFYIGWRMATGISDANEKSDMEKALNDFIEYSNLNLTWFAFNFVLICLPPIVIFVLQDEYLEIQGATGSYTPLVYILWMVHCIQIFLNLRIYKIEAQGAEEKTEHYTKVAKFDKDDQVMLEPTPGAEPPAD